MAARAPALPPRRQDTLEAAGLDEPPPAYEAQPHTQGEATLEFGPARPFQQAPAPPPQHGSHPAPPQHPSLTGGSAYHTNPFSAYTPHQQQPSNLGPPQFPFWNGASLTPAQTGFSEGPVNGRYHPPPHPPPGQGYHPPAGPPPAQQHISPQASGSSFHPPQGPPPTLPPRQAPGSGYGPTSTPTPGQPFLNNGRLLVYPVGREVCWKCSNTGYKQNDPSHPCRKCWEKFGKQYVGALKIAATSSSQPPPNYQRPLRSFAPPQQGMPGGFPGHQGPAWQGGMQQGPRPNVVYGAPPLQPGVVVMRPGDPRMGGVMCQKCGGAGITFGFFEDDTCNRCGGVGRLF